MQGIKFSYDGQPGVHRFISFEPLWDATFTVSFHSSSSSPRTLHIARVSGDEITDVITGTTDTNTSTISVELHAGERYYIWFTGGGTGYITSMHYEV